MFAQAKLRKYQGMAICFASLPVCCGQKSQRDHMKMYSNGTAAGPLNLIQEIFIRNPWLPDIWQKITGSILEISNSKNRTELIFLKPQQAFCPKLI
jgi:hypothetical protein